MISVYTSSKEMCVSYNEIYIMVKKNKNNGKNNIIICSHIFNSEDVYEMPPIVYKNVKEKFPDIMDKLENMELNFEIEYAKIDENDARYKNYKFIIDIYNFIMCK